MVTSYLALVSAHVRLRLLVGRARAVPGTVGFEPSLIGLLLSLTLFGDAVISLWMTTAADRVGRRRILIAGAALMLFAGLLFALTDRLELLLIAAIIGVISPSGYEVGPFLPVEQAALSQIVPDEQRTQILAWYNLVRFIRDRSRRPCGGGLTQLLQQVGVIPLNSYRTVVVVYGVIGVLLSPALHPIIRLGRGGTFGQSQTRSRFGLHRSRGVVLKLSTLFGLDAFAGGFVVQSIVAYWFHVRFGVEPAALGGIFFGANILAGISALASAWVAARIGLVKHDGVYSPPLEYPPGARTAHAEPSSCHCCFVCTVQHFPDGCAAQAILHNGRSRAR